MVSGGARSAPESNHRDDLGGSTPLALLAPLTVTERTEAHALSRERAIHLVMVSGGARLVAIHLVMVSGGARSAPESNHRDDLGGSTPLALLAPLTVTERTEAHALSRERAIHLVMVSGGARLVAIHLVMVSGGARSAPESNHRDDLGGSTPLALLAPLTVTERTEAHALSRERAIHLVMVSGGARLVAIHLVMVSGGARSAPESNHRDDLGGSTPLALLAPLTVTERTEAHALSRLVAIHLVMVSGGARSAPESNHRDDLGGSTPLALLAPLTVTERTEAHALSRERAIHLVMVSGGARLVAIHLVMVSGGARSAPESNHRDDLGGSTPLALLAPLTVTERTE